MMTNDFENRLDEIRVELYEKTKTLRNKDAVAAINAVGGKIAEKYGIVVAKAASAHSRLAREHYKTNDDMMPAYWNQHIPISGHFLKYPNYP